MSYEDIVGAKHEFQDSFSEFLTLLSVMTYREIEMAAAKLADSLTNKDLKINRESAMFSGEIIQIVLKLRDKEEMSESKIMRIFLRKKKSEFVRKAAAIECEPLLLVYKEELKKVKEIWVNQESEHARLLEDWHHERKKLSFLKRLFRSPPRPKPTIWAAPPVMPKITNDYELKLYKTWDFGKLLIYMVSHHSFSYIDQSRAFVNEESIKSLSIKLLSKK